jgi:hypothetical protein
MKIYLSVAIAMVVALIIMGNSTSAQSPNPTYVDTVAADLAPADKHTYTDIHARGFFSIGDGGGGWFAHTGGTNCNSVHFASYDSSSNTISVPGGTSGILVGMGVTGSGIAGTYVTSVTPFIISVFARPTGSGTSITVSGSVGVTNGGTILGDIVGTCFARVQPNPDVHAWGARCNVQAVNGGGAVWTHDADGNWGIRIGHAHLGSLVGLMSPDDTTAVITSGTAWTYGALPNPFPSSSIVYATVPAPLVFFTSQ